MNSITTFNKNIILITTLYYCLQGREYPIIEFNRGLTCILKLLTLKSIEF